MTESFPSISSLIPHRDNMVMLDRVIAVAEESLSAAVTITSHSMFFDEHENEVGAWIGIEYMAQAIAAFEGYQALQRGEAVKVGFLLGSRRYESHCSGFTLGSMLYVDVHRVLEHANGLAAFECRICDPDKQVLASATVTVFKPDNVHQFLVSTNQGGKR
jgi:predicted hotdog family 3-hydroxylacyl-ACP dehydratase